MTRSLPDWVGASSDTAIPTRVKLRVFERFDGRCHLTGRKITPGDAWEIDHVIALVNGGLNAETNLAPALKQAHRQKTNADVAQKSKEAAIRARHLGVKEPSKAWQSKYKRKLDGTTVLRG